MSSSDSSFKTIVLKSSDGEVFEVSQDVALQSQTIAHMIEDDCVDNKVSISNVTGKTLAKVIGYCKKHVAGDDGASSSTEDDQLKTWDAVYMKIEVQELYELILAAKFLNIKGLLDLSCQTVADMIKGKTPEEIRTTFNFKNDFSKEEEEEISKENQWTLE